MDQNSSFSNLFLAISPSQFGSNHVMSGTEPTILFDHKLSVSSENVELLRFLVGLIGNAFSILLYAAPILTFKQVTKDKSTGGFSCIPYITALLNCLIYTWYGSPLVSNNWENLPLVTINSVGIILELSFISVYLWFASRRGRIFVSLIMTSIITAFSAMVFVLMFEFQDRPLRKSIIGSIGFVFSIAMYGSPLVAMKRVIQTESVEYMPFFLSFFSFLTSASWLVYGLLGKDILLASPNFIGCPLGIIQLVLYCIYRGRNEVIEEPIKIDLESGGSSYLIQPLITNIDLEDDGNGNVDDVVDVNVVTSVVSER